MKSFRLLAFAIFFAVAAFTASAQTTPTGATKIAIIDTGAFGDEKAGIAKYIQALKSLQTELKPRQDEITALETKMTTLAKDIENLSKASVVDPKSIDAKREEGERMQLDYNYKKEQYKANVERRFAAIIGPIQTDIAKAIEEYGKQKGFHVIFDLSKDEKAMILWADMAAADITNDFIKFYNARPAAAAVTTAPAPK